MNGLSPAQVEKLAEYLLHAGQLAEWHIAVEKKPHPVNAECWQKVKEAYEAMANKVKELDATPDAPLDLDAPT